MAWVLMKQRERKIVPCSREAVVMFRRPSEPQFKLVPKDIVDHLEALLGISPGAKLSYRGTEVPGDEDLSRFKVAKATFLLGHGDPSRLVGFPGRYHAWDQQHSAWNYNSNYSCELR